MKERNYLLPLFAIGIGVFFIAVLVTGIVVWNRMPVMVSASPSATALPTPTATPTPTPIPIPTTVVAADPATTTATTATTPTSAIPLADQSIARLRSGFRHCYNRGLIDDPSLHGEITITIVVSPSGDVTNVKKKSGGIAPDVDQCIVGRARDATFAKSPSGGTVDVPLRFEHVK